MGDGHEFDPAPEIFALLNRVRELEAALRRIANMEMPPTGWSAYVAQIKEIARNALSARGEA